MNTARNIPSPSTRSSPLRLTVHELTPDRQFLTTASTALGMSPQAVTTALRAAARVARVALRLSGDTYSPTSVGITITDGVLRADGIAGMLRITPDLELQIVPKFLTPTDPGWVRDYLRLAVLTRYGRLLPSEALRGDTGPRGDLPTLLGSTLADAVITHSRRPIRAYRRHTESEFSVDGELDPLDLLTPIATGFTQSVLRLRRDTPHNAVLAAAVHALRTEVTDAATRTALVRAAAVLGPQRPARRPYPAAVPARYSHWGSAYDTARAVLDGLGVVHTPGVLHAPGFLVRTAKSWEDLVERAARTALGSEAVAVQPPYPLGTRQGGIVNVRPDIVVSQHGTPTCVVDAKYRTRTGRAAAVAADDLYETLAFLRATATTNAILVYPATTDVVVGPATGDWAQFDTITAGVERIHAIAIQVRGLADKGGYAHFAAGVANAVHTLLGAD